MPNGETDVRRMRPVDRSAHPRLTRVLADLAVRRGLFDGLVLGVFVVVVVFVGNVVLPPDYQDSPEKYAVAWSFVALAAVSFVVIGARGQRRANTEAAGVKAGGTAGLVVAVLFVGTFLIMDNLFFTAISQLPGKAGSTPASLTATALTSASIFLPVGMCAGALLGQLGASFVEERVSRSGIDRRS